MVYFLGAENDINNTIQKKDIHKHHSEGNLPADPAGIHAFLNEQIGHLSGELVQRQISDTIGIGNVFPATVAPWQLHQLNTPVREPMPPPPRLEGASAAENNSLLPAAEINSAFPAAEINSPFLAAENASPFSMRNMIVSSPIVSGDNNIYGMNVI